MVCAYRGAEWCIIASFPVNRSRAQFLQDYSIVRKALKIIGGLLAVIIVVFTAYVGSRQNLNFDKATPFPDIAASTDSAIIERGRYIVRDLAPCASCHAGQLQRAAAAKGEDVPLVGGYVFEIPPGKFYTRNLTPDKETGLGNVSDKAVARAIRYGVGHDGRALLPFMEMQGLSDDDLQAVVSYLRTMEPVRNEVPPHAYTTLGKVVKATAMANPVGPSATPLVRSPRGASVETGKYIVESVSLCWACHTDRSPMTGALVGPRYAGTTEFTEADDPGHSWSPPNITSDPETGRLGHITEDQFIARFRQGRLMPGSPMPWQSFSRMADDDLRSIYRYLKSIPPIKRDNGPPMVDVKKS